MICKLIKTIARNDGQLATGDGALFGDEFLAKGWTIVSSFPGVSVRETYFVVAKATEQCDDK